MADKRNTFKLGFTLIEGIIGTVLFVLVAGMAIMLLTNTLGSYSKGESASTSVQEAAIIINRIRHDLLQITFGSEENTYDYFQTLKTDTTSIGTIVNFDRENGTIQATSTEALKDGLIVKFFIMKDGKRIEIKYSYSTQSRSILRTEGSRTAKAYAVPRLKNFSLDLFLQRKPALTESSPPPSVAPTTPTTSLPLTIDGETIEPVKISQIWFKVIVSVQEENNRPNQKMKEVNIQSLIFPKQLNKQFQGRWKEWK